MAEAVTIGVRFGLYITLMLVFGVAAFGLYGLRGAEQRSTAGLRLGSLLAGAAVIGLLLSLLGLVALAAAMTGAPITSVDGEAMSLILWETTVGSAWQARALALALVVPAGLAFPRWPRAALISVTTAGAVALATLAWTGHGAATEGVVGWAHLVSDIAHLLAAGAWLGALAVLLLLLLRPSRSVLPEQLAVSHEALAGFSVAGTIIVGLIVLSGLVNGWVLIGLEGLSALPSSSYGQLLIAKLLLFGVMLLLAAANRFRLTPAFEAGLAGGDHRRSLAALRRSLAFESGCALAILALVAWLGTLSPPSSAAG